MHRQRGLFPGVTLSEDQLEALLLPLYPSLWSMIRQPFDELLVRRTNDPWFRIYTEGETAQAIRPVIIHRARQLFEGSPDMRIEEYRNQLFLNYQDQIAITPKKFKRKWLEPKLTFSSFETDQNKLWWQQRPSDGLPDLPRIIVGYLFVREMTDIQILVAYPRGKELRLCYLMPDQTGAILTVFKGADDWQDADQDRGFKIKPKKDVREPG